MIYHCVNIIKIIFEIKNFLSRMLLVRSTLILNLINPVPDPKIYLEKKKEVLLEIIV